MGRRQEQTHSLHLYGPVPSRRLGFSLGIDIIPFKTCTLDCVYCQLGRTVFKTLRRKKYFSPDEILEDIRERIASGSQIDCITFSGSGEPTLNTALGRLIRGVKKMTSVPVAVLTNATLFSQKSVRNDLMEADLVVPSLDAADQEVFEKINRPCSPLKVEDVIGGLQAFRREFKGQIWLEIMLVKGVNDSPAHLRRLKEAVARIHPDRVQLNTVARPPAEKRAMPLSREKLEKIQEFFGEKCEIIADFGRGTQKRRPGKLDEAILSMVKRRPLTLDDLSAALGRHPNEIVKSLERMVRKGRIRTVTHKGRRYFEPG